MPSGSPVAARKNPCQQALFGCREHKRGKATYDPYWDPFRGHIALVTLWNPMIQRSDRGKSTKAIPTPRSGLGQAWLSPCWTRRRLTRRGRLRNRLGMAVPRRVGGCHSGVHVSGGREARVSEVSQFEDQERDNCTASLVGKLVFGGRGKKERGDGQP